MDEKKSFTVLGIFLLSNNALRTAHSKMYTTAGNRRRLQKKHRKPQETTGNLRKPKTSKKTIQILRKQKTARDRRKPKKTRKPQKT